MKEEKEDLLLHSTKIYCKGETVAKYNHKVIEKKWRKYWAQHNINAASKDKKNYYCLDMFPYPSGNGIHVGHWRGYVLSDVWSRYKILNGYHVLHPMGWDAFGLPAENYAIKMKVHPSVATQENVERFKAQLEDISAVYDWNREVNTTDPDYYRWTQWIFVKMFEKGLAYEKEMPINWCPDCKTGLANEEVKDGKCDRCGHDVTKKNLRQWMLKITEYAQRLLDDLDTLDWPEKVKKMQTEWIGKSYGASVKFKVKDSDEEIEVFTTRPDTLYGATFMVLAPEHELVQKISSTECMEEVKQYVFDSSLKSTVNRMKEKDKTGVFTGAYALNPLSGHKIPIWISDYVLADYGTGAIMCVPAHDERDFEFAKKFGLDIVQVISEDGEEKELQEAYTSEGIMINSGNFNGIDSNKAKEVISEYIAKKGFGEKTINYKLRDWVFSRQRYWGEPIPIIHCEKCGPVAVPEKDLPVLLPDVESYEPTGTGESPLAAIDSFVNTTCPSCGGHGKRETNTMPQWAGSSWYFLRYVDVNNDKELVSFDKMKEWLPVDMYVGGIEHAVLHLLYARFYTKFLYDIGVVNFEEPFKKLFNQGMITKSGAKMSKSKGNVVSPDELVENYGSDSLRLYELFVGPPELDSEWDDRGIDGVYRFINKLWTVISSASADFEETDELKKLTNRLINDVTSRMEHFHMNTVVSAFMEYNNAFSAYVKKNGGIDIASAKTIVTLFAPFAPHASEELWQMLGGKGSVFSTSWPICDERYLIDDVITVPIQVNGKTKGTIEIAIDLDKEQVVKLAKDYLSDKIDTTKIVKEIVVPNKIVNIVVKK